MAVTVEVGVDAARIHADYFHAGTLIRTADFSPAADRNIMQTAAIFSYAPLPGATQKRASNIPPMKTA